MQFDRRNFGLGDAFTYPNANSETGFDETQFPLHDNLGNALERIDGRGITTTYTYNDPASAMTNINYPTSADDVAVAYDVYGRRTAMTDAVGSHAYSYDDNNTLLSNATTYTGLAAKTISYTYSDDGSRYQMVTPSGTFTYHHDGDGRMTSLVNPFSETSTWSYLDNSWLSTQKLENASSATVATTTYSYNALGEMTDLLNQDGEETPATLSQFGGTGESAMVYDAAGNRTSMPATITGNSTYSGTISYSYADNSGHTAPSWLTGESSTRLTGYSQSSSYDNAGNPTTFTGSSNSFNADNQNTANTYDGDGNPTTYGSATCAFDEENRATSLGTALTAGYDGDEQVYDMLERSLTCFVAGPRRQD